MARRTAADPRLGTTVADYRIVALAGRGGMSVVYRARDERLGRDVALKLLAPELTDEDQFRRRFLRESQVAASLHHPNIVPVYAAGEADGILYLAMRYVEGADLKALLGRDNKLAPERALTLLGQVAAALDTAHRHGLVHRDVKPANILLEGAPPEENAYLADFGLTKTDASRAATMTGQLVGTIDYVAPEQIRGRTLDGRADIYSLACVLYECLVGSPPFASSSEVAILYAHLQDKPLPPSERQLELTPAIDAVLSQGLAKQPDERQLTAGLLIAEARAAFADGALPASTSWQWRRLPGWVRKPWRFTGRRAPLVSVALLAAILLALIVSGGYLFGPGSGRDVFRSAELSSIDRRFAIRGQDKPPKNIVVVKIDDSTFRKLGKPWPFTRKVHAQVIKNLKAAGAKVIAYDIQFSEVSPGRAGILEDNAFMDASHAAGNLVFSTTEVNDRGAGKFLGGAQGLQYAKAQLGNGNFDPDPGGVIRRMPYELQGLKSFAVVTAERATGKTVHPFSNETKLIDFAGPAKAIPSIRFFRVYLNKFAPGLVKNKIVVVGAATPELHDVHPVSFGQDKMPDPAIQANAIATLMRGLPLTLVPRWVNLVATFVLGIVAMLAGLRLRRFPALLVSLGVAVIYLVVAQVAFDAGMVLPVIYPLFALAVVTFFLGSTQLGNARS